MSTPVRWVAAAAVALVATMATQVPKRGAEPASAPGRGTFAYKAGTTAGDQRLFESAVAVARPEAQRLIARVAGRVEVSFEAVSRGSALGVTQTSGDGEYSVDVDVPSSMAAGGERAVQRVVLHELGHVVDHALLSEDLRARLDASFPARMACPPKGCADRTERFAETFAKWSLGDIGASLYVGYAVPPPVVTLDRWGEPLAALRDA